MLFVDASRINVRKLRADAGLPVRLLGIGLPLTIGLGCIVAAGLYRGTGLWVAAVIAAAVAPTDAALGAADRPGQAGAGPHPTGAERRERTRTTGSRRRSSASSWLVPPRRNPCTGPNGVASAAVDLLGGAGMGIAIGVGGACSSGPRYARGLSAPAFRTLTPLAWRSWPTPAPSKWCERVRRRLRRRDGLRQPAAARARADDRVHDVAGEVLSLLVWFIVGAAMLVPAFQHAEWQDVVFAVLALTVIRMVPVAIACVGLQLDRRTVAFIGWFGPRGLASVIFALLAVDTLAPPDANRVLAAVTITVVLSVLAHGITASPFAARYGAAVSTLHPERRAPTDARAAAQVRVRQQETPRRCGAMVTEGRAGRIGGTVALVPIVGWIRSYDRSWLRGDLIAGVAVAALIVPKNLGYAGIAGIPLQNGLYAAAAGAILYPIFGTSRQISTGPSSGWRPSPRARSLSPASPGPRTSPSFVAAITLASGALFLLLAVLRMGWIAQFLSRAVVTGFLFGAAIDVVIGELPEADRDRGHRLEPAAGAVVVARDARRRQLATVLVGVAALGGRVRPAGDRAARPGALVLVVGGLLASWLFDLGARGVALVGEVPRGLPTSRFPHQLLMRTCRHDRDRRGGARADRVLADGRRRQDVRGQAPLPDRHQPGVGRPGHGERRRRPVPGDAGLDEPVRELAERPLRRAHRACVPRPRRDRPADPSLAGAAVLGPA